jgi:molybdenum cofactor biosynthesis protein B
MGQEVNRVLWQRNPGMHPLPPARPLKILVLTVSTSRTASEDISGQTISRLLKEAGHQIAESSLVPDDPGAIGEILDKALKNPGIDALISTGGTGISARDCTPGVVEKRLDRVLPGFGELFRMLSFKQVGARALLSSALAGIAKGKPVFALPGSVKAVELAMTELILPIVGHLVEEVAKETPLDVSLKSQEKPAVPKEAAPPKEEPVIPPGTTFSQLVVDDRPKEAEIASGWQAGIRGIGGTLLKPYHAEIPEFFHRFQPCMDVLQAAGERGQVKLGDGRTFLALGYPDLVRTNSKVLLVEEAEKDTGWPEILAIHRWPKKVGTSGSIAVAGDADPDTIALERTGRGYTGPGTVFAVEGASVYLVDRKKIAQWDGKNLSPWEPMSSFLASLLLFWSGK